MNKTSYRQLADRNDLFFMNHRTDVLSSPHSYRFAKYKNTDVSFDRIHMHHNTVARGFHKGRFILPLKTDTVTTCYYSDCSKGLTFFT